MKKYSKIAVVGGTGKSGKYLVQELVYQGYKIKMLVRNPNHLTVESPLIEVVQGDVCDSDTVKLLLLNCDAVISTLGMGVPYDNPVVCSMGTQNIVESMSALGLERYIAVTGLNVDTPFDKKGPKTKFATDWMYQNYPKTTTDRQDEYHLLSKSELAWTLVRLPMIKLTHEHKKFITSLEDCLGDEISATDLAQFLIRQLDDTRHIRQAPFLFNV